MNSARYLFWSVIAVCVTFLLYRAGQAIAESNAEVERKHDAFRSQLKRLSSVDIGDCIPVRLLETDDETRFVIIGDYRKDNFVVLQRFVDGYRTIYPASGSVPSSVKNVILKLEAAP